MRRASIFAFAIFWTVASGCGGDATPTPAAPVREPESAVPVEAEPPGYELVHVHGRFLSVAPTNHRHQSYIFEFEVQYEMSGRPRAWIEKSRLVRFELPQDFGGRDLLAELGGPEHLPGRFDDGMEPMPSYELVLWLHPAVIEERPKVNATLVKSPVAVRN